MHINSALSTYFWDTKVRTFLLLDFQVFKPVFYCEVLSIFRIYFPGASILFQFVFAIFPSLSCRSPIASVSP